MKKFFIVISVIFSNNYIWAQKHDNLLHDVGFYNTIEWTEEERPSMIPQAWIYIKDYYIEARYNYEDNKTAALYFGKAFAHKKKAIYEIIPMIGFAFGKTNGFSPAFNFKLKIGRFSTFTQCQYTVDIKDNNNSFFWDWTNFYWSINKFIELGGALQVFRSGDRIYNLGPMLRFQHNSFALEAYAYNLWKQHPIWALGFEYNISQLSGKKKIKTN